MIASEIDMYTLGSMRKLHSCNFTHNDSNTYEKKLHRVLEKSFSPRGPRRALLKDKSEESDNM